MPKPETKDEEKLCLLVSVRRRQWLSESTIIAPVCKLIKAKGLVNLGGFVAEEELVHDERTIPFKYFSPQILHRDDQSLCAGIKLTHS